MSENRCSKTAPLFKNKSPRQGTETGTNRSDKERNNDLKTKAPVRGRRLSGYQGYIYLDGRDCFFGVARDGDSRAIKDIYTLMILEEKELILMVI